MSNKKVSLLVYWRRSDRDEDKADAKIDKGYWKSILFSMTRPEIPLYKEQIETVNETGAMRIYQLFSSYYDAMMTFQIFRYNVTFIFVKYMLTRH